MRRRPRVYIRPTVAGLWWIGTLLILFVIGWGYSNNLCLGIAVCLLALTLVFLMETHFNLEHLKILELAVDDQFAQRPASFRLRWESRKARIRRQIRVEWDGDTPTQTWPTPAWQGPSGESAGALVFERRGHHRAGHVRLSSSYPIGLFLAWSYHPVKGEAWIYPSPLQSQRPWEGERAESEDAQARQSFDGDEPGEFRRYSLGDPPGRVAWKVLARGLPPHTKTFEAAQGMRRLYRWPWGAGGEEERGLLSGAIQRSFEAGDLWALQTPSRQLGWGSDALHRQDALRLLAEDAP